MMTDTMLMIVGCLNRKAPYFEAARGVGLSVFAFDPAKGTATLVCEESGVDNPSFLSVDAERGCVYATSEVFGWQEGMVTAYRWDATAHRLRYINKQPSLGSITAHSSFDRPRRHLFVANYGMGDHDDGPDRAVVVYPLRPDGGLGGPIASVAHRGQGPDTARQERAHPHCVIPSPDGRFAVVADLGLDAVTTYGFGADGQLSETPVSSLAMAPGAGPRHVAFHPSGRQAVVICEMGSTLSLLDYTAETGAFAFRDTVSALPSGVTVANDCSDVQIHPNGRFVYGANRGHDSVAIFAIDSDGNRLSPLGHQPCGGRTPRNLAIDPTARFLIVANQNGDNLVIFAIDPDQGTLFPAGEVPVGTPMCVRFMAASTP